MNALRSRGGNHRQRALLALLVAILTSLAWSAPAAAQGLIRISQDPYSADDCQHATEVEPDISSYQATLVATFQVGRCFNGGATNIGWATSQDNGQNWTYGFMPGITVAEGGPYPRVSDPSVAYDQAHGVWMVSSLALTLPGPNPVGAEVLVSRSADGVNWDKPVSVYLGVPGQNLDKNWTRCDNWPSSPNFGNCYTTFDDNGDGDRIKMTTSSDGGLTWSKPVEPAGRPTGLGGQPQPLPDGTVVVPEDNAFETAVISFRSTDGGASWGDVRTVSNIQGRGRDGDLRSPPLVSAATDADGKVYVVWHDCRFEGSLCSSSNRPHDVLMTTTTDGLSWSPLSLIPIGDEGGTVDHLTPSLGADRNTNQPNVSLAFAYYFHANYPCTVDTCQTFVGYASSPDGGDTWTAQLLTTDPLSLTWLANTTQGHMTGDYYGNSFSDNALGHPVFALANPPGNQLDEAIHTIAGGLGPGGHGQPGAGRKTTQVPRSTAPIPGASAAPVTAR